MCIKSFKLTVIFEQYFTSNNELQTLSVDQVYFVFSDDPSLRSNTLHAASELFSLYNRMARLILLFQGAFFPLSSITIDEQICSNVNVVDYNSNLPQLATTLIIDLCVSNLSIRNLIETFVHIHVRFKTL